MRAANAPERHAGTIVHLTILVPAVALGATAIATGLAVTALGTPQADAQLLSVFLAGSGTASLGIAYFGLGLAVRLHAGGLLLKLTVGHVLGVLVLCTNVAATAFLMFISPHDLGLLALLILFASALALVFTFSLARTITGAVRTLVLAAECMGQGDLSVRVELKTGDELEALGQTFNRMAQELQAAAARQRELEYARRELIAAVSHDLRTPLAILQAMVEAINDGVVADPSTLERYHQTMLREVHRFGQLVDDLFELSQIDAGALRLHVGLASLADLVSDTLTSMGPQAAARSIHLTGALVTELPPVRCDAARIQRVLYNLVQNALRHTPAGGRVTLAAQDAGTAVQIEVSDTGEGIPDDDRPYVFDRFYRGERSRNRETGGAGLGLAIAKGIVEAHGGIISVDSQPGQGATFRFTLPYRQEQAGTRSGESGESAYAMSSLD